MRIVVWSQDALRDLIVGIRHIAQSNPVAAGLVADRIDEAAIGLADWSTGRPGRVAGTLEKVVPKTSYILSYKLSDDTVTILRVIHGRRNWPDEGWPDEG